MGEREEREREKKESGESKKQKSSEIFQKARKKSVFIFPRGGKPLSLVSLAAASVWDARARATERD